MKTLRVLIVEDYRDTANLVAIWVTSAGHTAQICATAFAATEAMPDFCPDVVLLDIGLPDMDGWELAPLLRQENPDLTIVAITAYQSLDDRQRSKDAGINLHLGKPLQRDKILALLALATADQPIA
jgi:CheY-like chemotaxis protein